MTDIFSKGHEAILRVYALGLAAVSAGLIKVADTYWWAIPRWTVPGALSVGGAKVTFKNLTFFLDPSPLLIGFGAIIGLRIGVSLLLGAVLAWGVIGPEILQSGWVAMGDENPDSSWFATMVNWLLWPGVALMVTSSIASFALMLMNGRGCVPQQ